MISMASNATNTLADFRVGRRYAGENGQPGAGKNQTGKSGDALYITVPCGTVVHDVDTGELIGDLTGVDQQLKVAEAGQGGLGNTRFKSSINRAPRKITRGTDGEGRHLRLELKVIADVGLVGIPNAGKSTLIRSLSAAKPKVADYPFTTLHPNLGVVFVGPLQSFVMADIPGLIEGAAEGTGLGIQFLKHLQRTRLLLHLVDIAPIDAATDPATEFRSIEKELAKFSADLSTKPRWLVINKMDLLAEDQRAEARDALINDLQWQGPVFEISAISGEGTEKLAQAVMLEFDRMNEIAAEEAIAETIAETSATAE
jgi:GTP-binding protein